jgi:PAS domain-containing protein
MRVAWHLVRSAGDDIRVADGVLMAGKTRLDDNRLVDELAQMVGGVATIFCGDLRIASNVPDRDGRRATGTRLAPGPVFDTVLRDHVSFRGTTEILGRPYYAGYDPIKDVNGDTVGMLFVGLSQEGFVAGLAHTRNTILATSLVALVIIGIGFAWLARSLGQQIRSRQITLETSNLRLDTALERMSQGLCFFDGSSRLIVANRRYAEIYDIEPAAITPGMTLQDITELRRAAGSGAKIADPDYLQWRGKIARENTPNDTVVDLANGRVGGDP